MASSASVLSRALQSITLTKIRELEKQRETYEGRKGKILEEASIGTNGKDRKAQLERLAFLLAGVKELYPDAANDDATLSNIQRWLDQAHYDATMPDEKLESFEAELRSKLEIQSRKLGLADLYSRLLMEWMDSGKKANTASNNGKPPKGSGSDEDEEDSFEVVERQKERLKQLCDKFESVVFEPLETDEQEIGDFVTDLFTTDEGSEALTKLREKVKDKSMDMLAEKKPFDDKSLTYTIKGLLTEDLLSDEKQTLLRDFLQNPIVLGEMADVLNMRYADIKHWDWDAGADGIPVMSRQQLNGKYRIWMDEDILQTIFVQYIGVRLCNLLKAVLKDVAEDSPVWQWSFVPKTSPQDLERRRYFLDYHTSMNKACIEKQRKEDYLSTFFLSQLPATQSTLHETGGWDYDGDNADDEVSSDGDSDVNVADRTEKTDAEKSGIKQKLLRKVATEVLLHRHLYGKAAVVQSDLQWYATGLPHSTIFGVMKVLGFHEDLITFFTKYLESPLNMDHSADDRTPSGPRIRKRGVPMAHSSEKFTGELILFLMDLAVNKEAGMLLYRLHDDLWLVGEPEKCAKAWDVMQRFAIIMGLEYNMMKTGSVYLTSKDTPKDSKIADALPKGAVAIGFLQLNENGDWTLDQKLIGNHIAQLQTQLSACDSVLAWVQTWNSCIGRFFKHTFGEPAFCFGPSHVDSILSTYQRMQRVLFNVDGNSDSTTDNVSAHIKQMIQTRFNATDIPNAFLFLPEQLGGLGLRNPFISLFLVRDQLTVKKDPNHRFASFLTRQKNAYTTAKKAFDELTPTLRRRRYNNIYHTDSLREDAAVSTSERDTFFTYEEYTRFWTIDCDTLLRLYKQLMDVPPKQDIQLTPPVSEALRKLERSGQISSLALLDAEKKWALQLYADELLTRYGGLSLVEKSFLPVGVLAMMRKKKVAWKMVL